MLPLQWGMGLILGWELRSYKTRSAAKNKKGLKNKTTTTTKNPRLLRRAPRCLSSLIFNFHSCPAWVRTDPFVAPKYILLFQTFKPFLLLFLLPEKGLLTP